MPSTESVEGVDGSEGAGLVGDGLLGAGLVGAALVGDALTGDDEFAVGVGSPVDGSGTHPVSRRAAAITIAAPERSMHGA